MTSRSTRPPRVVIVGGGFGGLNAALALRGVDAEVLLFDRHNHHLFQPLLYQVATAALSPGDIAAPIRRIFRHQRNCEVAMGEVTAIDPERRTVTVGGERYAYDYLVLAAGSITNYLGHDEWGRFAPGLKTIDEALDVRSRLLLAFEQAELETDEAARRAALTFAIVGAGPTGVEMAGAIAEIGLRTLRRDFRRVDTGSVRVILIDLNERVLPAFEEATAKLAQRHLDELGVETMLGTKVVGVEPGTLSVEGPDGTTRIEAHNVVWAAGVRASALGRQAAASTDRAGRVEVGDDLTVPGHPELFVVGDLARRTDPRSGKLVPGVAQGAIQMGRFAGRAIAKEIRARARGESPPSRGAFVYRDKGSLATIGRNKAVAELWGTRFGGTLAWLLWALVHITFLIGFRRRFLVLAEWSWMYFFHARGVRLITGEGRVPRPVKPPPDPRLSGD